MNRYKINSIYLYDYIINQITELKIIIGMQKLLRFYNIALEINFLSAAYFTFQEGGKLSFNTNR